MCNSLLLHYIDEKLIIVLPLFFFQVWI